MKKLILAFLATTSLAFAGDTGVVKLDQKHIHLDSDHALVALTSETPSKVMIHMPISFVDTICTKFETRYVWGLHPSCGYYYPYPDHRYPGSYRSCYHPVTVCVETGERIVTEERKVILKLKKDVKIENETIFELQGAQSKKDSWSVDFSFEATDSASSELAVKIKSFPYEKIVISNATAAEDLSDEE